MKNEEFSWKKRFLCFPILICYDYQCQSFFARETNFYDSNAYLSQSNSIYITK